MQFDRSLYESADGLLDYFVDRPVDLWPGSRLSEDWSFWLNDYLSDRNKEAFAKYLGCPFLDIGPADYYRLPRKVWAAFADWLDEINEVAIIRHETPDEAPAWMFLSPNSDASGDLRSAYQDRLLFHVTDTAVAESIRHEGFIVGCPDINDMALTWQTCVYTGKSTRRHNPDPAPGYNYAYSHAGKVKPSDRIGSYGGSIIMFRASGVDLYHYGDQEDQVGFWGPSVDKGRMFRTIVPEATTGWHCVETAEASECLDDLCRIIAERDYMSPEVAFSRRRRRLAVSVGN